MFEAVKLTKNTDLEKHGYKGYIIEFDSRSQFSLPGSGVVKNVANFYANISSSRHIDTGKKRYLNSWWTSKDGLDDTTISW